MRQEVKGASPGFQCIMKKLIKEENDALSNLSRDGGVRSGDGSL